LASFSFQDQAVSPPSFSFTVNDLTAEKGDEASCGQALPEENQANLNEILFCCKGISKIKSGTLIF
jgi:hypothetical protein